MIYETCPYCAGRGRMRTFDVTDRVHTERSIIIVCPACAGNGRRLRGSCRRDAIRATLATISGVR